MSDPKPDLVPSAAEQMAWIEAICAQGIRRPASEADRWAESFVVERFSEFGLEGIHLEPVTLPRWEPHTWSLDVDGETFDLVLQHLAGVAVAVVESGALGPRDDHRHLLLPRLGLAR